MTGVEKQNGIANYIRVYIIQESQQGSTKHLRKSQTTIYTDGSKINNRTGSGFVIYHKNIIIYRDNRRLPDSCTVFQAEIEAINLAGKYIL